MQPIFRFAPSPSGFLHIGHAYSALLNHDIARRAGGRLLLRIEDIDSERSRPEYTTAIIEDCEWLGLHFERPIRRQSEHIGEYTAALNRLREMGLAYPAFLSRTALTRVVDKHEKNGGSWPRDPDGSPHYPADDRSLPPDVVEQKINAGAPYAIRLNTARAVAETGPISWREFPPDTPGELETVEAKPARWGDIVLAGREIPASYHLAVIVDDAAQGISHVVRGADLRAATAIHRLLQTLLGLSEPAYCHHRLILDRAGRKLSKTDRDVGLSARREEGVSAEEIRGMVGIAPG